jgi:hypothetical protein
VTAARTRADPRASDSAALLYAAKNGKVAVVEALLRDGRADPRASDSAALRRAAKKGKVHIRFRASHRIA